MIRVSGKIQLGNEECTVDDFIDRLARAVQAKQAADSSDSVAPAPAVVASEVGG